MSRLSKLELNMMIQINKYKALLFTLTIFTSTIVFGEPTAQSCFKQLIGEEFVDDGTNTVHEWVYDFLLAVEEGDEELLREQLAELKQVDAGNRAVLLNAGTKLAKELHRDRQWQMLKGRLNRFATIPATFSLEAAEACELTQLRSTQKAREAGNSSFSEWLMSNMAFKTAFVVAAGLPVAVAGSMVVNTTHATSISAVSKDLFPRANLADLPYLSDAYQKEAVWHQRDLHVRLDEFMSSSRDAKKYLTMGYSSVIDEIFSEGFYFQSLADEFKDMLPHLLVNKIISEEDAWASVFRVGRSRYSIDEARLLLEGGADENFKLDGMPILYDALINARKGWEKFDAVGELLLEFGADPLLSLVHHARTSRHDRFKLNNIAEFPAAFFEKIKEIWLDSYLRGLISDKIATEYRELISSLHVDHKAIEKLSNIWISLIKKGLSFELRRFWEPGCGETCKRYQSEFIIKLVDMGVVDVNKRVGKEKSLFESALATGKFELVKQLRARGGRTDRPIILLVTSKGGGYMYESAKRALNQREIPTITITPFDPLDVKLLAQIRHYSKRPREVLNSGIPEIEQLKELAKEAFSMADAVWISGGAHVWESWYSERVGLPKDLARDILEMAILDLQSRDPYKPLIGVCRGIQMINVFHGGTLREVGQSGTNPLVVVKKDGPLASAFPAKPRGWSGHSQSVEQLAEPLEAVALSEDGMVKGVQSKTKEVPLIGTQFHPEVNPDSDETGGLIFKRFIEMAEASKRQTCFEPDVVSKQCKVLVTPHLMRSLGACRPKHFLKNLAVSTFSFSASSFRRFCVLPIRQWHSSAVWEPLTPRASRRLGSCWRSDHFHGIPIEFQQIVGECNEAKFRTHSVSASREKSSKSTYLLNLSKYRLNNRLAHTIKVLGLRGAKFSTHCSCRELA
jgi:putative glutamine amidotransferase